MKHHGAILLAANYSNTTGYAWRNIFRLYNSIARGFSRHGVRVCMSFATIEEPVQILDSDIPFETFTFDPKHITPASVVRLISAVKKHDIQYIYLTDMSTWHWLYAVLRFIGVRRIVVHCRISVPDPHPPRPEQGIKRYLKTAFNRNPVLHADYIYAISDFVRQRLINKTCYPENRVIEIPNGIDTGRYQCPEKPAVRDRVIIFCCARATRHKGIPTLIKAASMLLHQFQIDNFHINYAGDGRDLEAFRKLAGNLNVSEKITFLGQLKSTHEHACAADIIVVPSEWGEGFGSTVAEGMAAGKALVATTAGGIPEVVGGPEFGRLYPPGNSRLLAEILRDLIGDQETRWLLGKNARDRACKLFDEKQYHNRVTERLMHDFQP